MFVSAKILLLCWRLHRHSPLLHSGLLIVNLQRLHLLLRRPILIGLSRIIAVSHLLFDFLQWQYVFLLTEVPDCNSVVVLTNSGELHV